MASVKFPLSGLTWGYRINKKKSGTGFIHIEESSQTIAVKTIISTKPLVELNDIQTFTLDKKVMSLFLSNEDVVELKAKPHHLEVLKHYLLKNTEAKEFLLEKKNESSVRLLAWFVFFFPIGLYKLYKSNSPMSFKLGITAIISFCFLLGITSQNTQERNSLVNKDGTARQLATKDFVQDKNILSKIVSKQHLGGQVEVHYLFSGDTFKAAQECVSHFLNSYKSAYCYVFNSKAAYSYAEVDKKNGGMNKLCYSSAYGKALSGNMALSISDNSLMMKSDNCPTGKK